MINGKRDALLDGNNKFDVLKRENIYESPIPDDNVFFVIETILYVNLLTV